MSRPAAFALLQLVGVVLAVFELLFQSTYLGPVPVPAGTVLILVSLPWLVRASADEVPSATGAAAPVLLWFLATAVVGGLGPGGDVLLPFTWQTALLVLSGVVVGLFSMRRTTARLAAAARADADGGRPHDPRIGGADRVGGGRDERTGGSAT